LFQVLRVPYVEAGALKNEIELLSGAQNLNSITIPATPENAAAAKIHTKVSNLSADVETVLTALLDRWIELGTDVTSLDGSVASVSGITCSTQLERKEIRDQVIYIVPFLSHHDQIKKTSGASFFVPMTQ